MGAADVRGGYCAAGVQGAGAAGIQGPRLDAMAYLTPEQEELLSWIVEDASSKYVFVETHDEGASLLGEHGERPVNAGDVHQLVDYGLLRQATTNSFEITNDGRAYYERMTNPPPPRPPIGFQPPAV
jgi:hypothetical protein